MHKTEQIILEEFKKYPSTQISTTQLVRAAHKEIYLSINKELISDDKKKSTNAKRLKAKLHRNTLHHINKLINEGIIKQTNKLAKGEKTYSLSIEEGEITIRKRNKQITILKKDMPTHIIQDLEEKNIVIKFSRDNWLSKINCILYQCNQTDTINKLKEKINKISNKINDCIGIHGFEKILQNEDMFKILRDFDSMIKILKEQNLTINIFIDVDNLILEKKLIELINHIFENNHSNVNICFQANAKNLREKSELFNTISEKFYNFQSKINLQNKDIRKSPIILGRAGTYALDEKEWNEADLINNPRMISIANISITIDLGHLYKTEFTIKSFRQTIQKVATTLFKANISWTKSDKQEIQNELKDFFKYQKCYIRFWNFDFADKKQEHFFELLQSVKQDTDSFCALQRSIYNTCGLPTNFKIAFSSTLNSFSINLSERNYTKTTIKHISEYTNETTTSFIKNKENLLKIFDGGDRSRFFRKGDFSPQNFSRETAFLLSSCSLPLITLDFNETKGEIKLTSFFDSSINNSQGV